MKKLFCSSGPVFASCQSRCTMLSLSGVRRVLLVLLWPGIQLQPENAAVAALRQDLATGAKAAVF